MFLLRVCWTGRRTERVATPGCSNERGGSDDGRDESARVEYGTKHMQEPRCRNELHVGRFRDIALGIIAQSIDHPGKQFDFILMVSWRCEARCGRVANSNPKSLQAEVAFADLARVLR